MQQLFQTLFQLRPESWLIVIFVMLPLSLYFGVVLIGAARFRRTETTHLKLIREKITPQLDSEDGDIDDADDLAEDLRALALNFPADSVVRQLVVAVSRARLLATPDMQAVTSALSVMTESRLATVRNIPNLLMLAGLLGTVLGLAASLGKLAPQIASAAKATEPGELARALGGTLEVMQSAFGASLWGILLSLAASLLYTFVSRSQEHFQDSLTAFAHAELVPAVFPRALAGQMDKLGRYLRDAGSSFQEIHVKLQGVAGQLETVLGQAGATLGDSLTKLSETSAQVGAVFGSMDQTVKELTEGLNKGIGELVQAQEGAATSLRASSQEIQQRLGEQAHTVSRLQETVTDRTSSILQRVQEVSEALGRAGNKFEQSGEALQVEQSNYAARLDRNFDELTRTLGQTQAAQSQAAQTQAAQLGSDD